MESNSKNIILHSLFIISLVGIFGGAVNLGAFGIFPAFPFLIFAFYWAIQKRGKSLIVLVAVLVVSGGMYLVKITNRSFFFPALGQDIFVSKDICLTQFDKSVLVSELDGECDHKSLGGAIGSHVLEKNTKLKIDQVEVSHSDFGEHYILRAKTEYGLIYYRFTDKGLFNFKNGEIVEVSDLRREIFYYPSLLMYWPLIPIAIF